MTTLAETERLLREWSAVNSVVMQAFCLNGDKIVRVEGWRLSIRVLPGSPLHLQQAGLADSFRIFVAPTLEGCWQMAIDDAASRRPAEEVDLGDLL